MEGYAAVENHRSIKLEDRQHVHLLIRPDRKYLDYTLNQHIDIFEKAACEVKDNWKMPVFKPQHINLQCARDEGCAGYIFKDIVDRKLDRIKIIGVDGLSDNLDI